MIQYLEDYIEDRPQSKNKLAFTSYVLVVWPIAALALYGMFYRISLDWPVLETPGLGYGVFIAAAITGIISIVVGALLGLWIIFFGKNRDNPSSEYAWMAVSISVLVLYVFFIWHEFILPTFARS